MRTTSKILILALSIIIAVGAVMIYAKTQVEPPVALKSNDQYIVDLNLCVSALKGELTASQEDSLFALALDRTALFAKEDKISNGDADKKQDALVSVYKPLFFKRSFNKFLLSTWYDADHNYMLTVSKQLRGITHTDRTQTLTKSAVDSLATIENIIAQYRQARALTKRTSFNGVTNAQNVISQANRYAKDQWLSHCTDLVSALNNVKPSIAQSHYRYVVSMVEKLSQYRSYSQNQYENVLVAQVDAAVTEYENKAAALYGNRKNVDDLWSRARSYYNAASEYYN